MKEELGRIAEWVGGRLCDADGATTVEHVAVDTRKHLPDNTLYVALAGDNFDGHDYAEAALDKGAVAAVVQAGGAYGAMPRIEVEGSTLEALQRVAGAWRAQFDGVVVGVTGSHGKTIVKEMLASILSQSRRVHRSPGSYNSQVGVALSLLELELSHDVAIIEAGVSLPGEMDRLEAMIRPTCGVLTTIGKAHFATLGGDLERTASEKFRLFRRTEGPVVIPANSPHLDAGDFAHPISFGTGAAETGYSVANLKAHGRGFQFDLRGPGGFEQSLELGSSGRYNVGNAVAAIALSLELGATVADIEATLPEFETAPMRLEMHTTQSGVTILNDAYVSDPTSARAAVEELEFYGTGHRKVAILGDMRELGELAADAHFELGEFVSKSGVDRMVAVGEWATEMAEGALSAGMMPDSVDVRDDLEGLSMELEDWLEPGDFVLFKGSRAVGLDRLAAGLVESVAPERLEVDLDAIRANVHAVRNTIGGSTDGSGLMAVVKSFAYGNDATRVSQTLVREGVSWLAVAYPDEAIPLRRKGIDVPILVTNVLAAEADKFAKYDLTALVSSREVVAALSRDAVARGAEVPVHIEVDTGMSRMGVTGSAAVELASAIEAAEGVWLEGVMTHFAAADDPQEDTFTRGQIAEFDRTVAALVSAGHDALIVHAANTAAAWRFPEARYDLVRIGLGLYGVAPSAAVAGAATFVPALRFTSRVLQVRNIDVGETVGYGRSWRAERPSRVATVAIGYNDGFPRFMSNGGEVLIRGQRCPVVGNVCMDATMVDVTDLGAVAEGDEVVLFGSQGDQTISVDEIAARGGTISYEILTGISPRVRRIFRRSER